VVKKSVRIGGAGGFWGDSNAAMTQLVRQGRVDYIIHDYLAELTMAILAKQRQKDANAGYATDLVTQQLPPVLKEIAAKGIRIVTNAGGINPRACAAALRKLIDEQGLRLSVGIVEGDDLKPIEGKLRDKKTVEMFSGAALPEKISSMNAYIGAFPVAAALNRGADIVVTGRCADSALVLGPLIHEFGWKVDDYDLLAAGTLAGHIIECGTQTTGGIFTDWDTVPGRDDLGYPIAECFPDGVFHLTKPHGTGGLISPLVAAEQMLYEVTDPRNYVLPDVACDLSDVEIEQIEPETVRFTKVKGRSPTGTYKVSAIYTDGYRASSTLTIIGRDATAKAQTVGNSIIQRVRNLLKSSNLGDFTEVGMETLGSEIASFGSGAKEGNPREIVLRISVRHPVREAVELFSREIAPFGTAGTPGTTGFSGRPKAQQVFRLFSFLVEKGDLDLSVAVDGEDIDFVMPTAGGSYQAAVSNYSREPDEQQAGPCVTVPLRSIAIARSGDKADISHLAIIARHRDFYPLLLAQLTSDQMAVYLNHLVKGEVERHDVPGVNGLIFVMHEALGGGGTASQRSDALGKAFGEISLDMEIDIPAAWQSHPSFRSYQ
jgi:hypothetical protein